jgi:hypothetical protein
METGTVTLTNTKSYPFNDSAVTVALRAEQSGTDYFVLTEVAGDARGVESVRVYDKAVNGFRIAFEGSAGSADIRYRVMGGGDA